MIGNLGQCDTDVKLAHPAISHIWKPGEKLRVTPQISLHRNRCYKFHALSQSVLFSHKKTTQAFTHYLFT